MREKDIKLLWGRAAGRCAICGCKLTQDTKQNLGAIALGEHAHIVGKQPGSARYEDGLSDNERESYANHILLCPTDHVVIDKAPEEWSAGRLHIVKAEHELRIEQTSGEGMEIHEDAALRIYSHVMDVVTEKLMLEQFTLWASNIFEPYWSWNIDIYSAIEGVRHRVFATDWPGRLPALEVALDRATFELQEAAALFTNYSTPEKTYLVARRGYKERWHKQDVYERLDSEFWLWSSTLEQRLIETTKALNWVREVWRTQGNPMWLVTSGWFTLRLHPDASLRTGYLKPIYSEEEKRGLLDQGVGRGDIRAPAPPDSRSADS